MEICGDIIPLKRHVCGSMIAKREAPRQCRKNVQVSESMAAEKLDCSKVRRHLRGMKFVQMKRANAWICVLTI